MIRNAKVGEQVRLLGNQIFGHEMSMHNQVVNRWPHGCGSGTITRVGMPHRNHRAREIWVKPNHPDGVGESRFKPTDLARIK